MKKAHLKAHFYTRQLKQRWGTSFPLVVPLLLGTAQAQDLEWVRGDGGSGYEAGRGVVAMEDGGCIVVSDRGINQATKELTRYSASGEQTWSLWPITGGGIVVRIDDIDTAPDGSIALCGWAKKTSWYGGTRNLLFGGGAHVEPIDPGENKLFAAKYDGEGTLVWAHAFTTQSIVEGGGDKVIGLTGLSDGSYAISGTWRGELDLGDGHPPLTSRGWWGPAAWSSNAFVARIGSWGDLQFVRQIVGGNVASAASLDATPQDDIIFAGSFNDSDGALFGEGEAHEILIHEPASQQHYVQFVARIDSQGETAWARKSVDSGSSFGAVRAKPVDLGALPDGSFLMSGYHGYSSCCATFGPGQANETTILAPSGQSYNHYSFVARFDASGALEWAVSEHSGLDTSYGLAVQGFDVADDGSSVMAGWYHGTAVFGDGEENETTFYAPRFTAFSSRYNPDGTLAWAKSVESHAVSNAWDASISQGGETYVVGDFKQRATFEAGQPSVTEITTVGNYYSTDRFLVKYGSNGMSLVVPEGISAQCDDAEAHTATVNFLVEVVGTPTSGASLLVSDLATNTLILQQPAQGGVVGVGPLGLPMGVSTLVIEIELDGSALATETLEVIVEDSIPPTIYGTGPKTIECQAEQSALYPTLLGITAVDECDSSPEIDFAPPLVALGSTPVTVSASDRSGNTSSAEMVVTVIDTVAPTFTSFPEEPILRECTSAEGASVSFTIAAEDACGEVTIDCRDQDGSLVDPSGTLYQLGSTFVTCTATDSSGNQEALTFEILVVDNTAPVLACPADITVGNDPGGCGATVSFAVDVTDLCDPDVPVVVVDAEGLVVDSGAFFPVGSTTLTAHATDHAGNSASCSFNITVEDVEAPEIQVPSSVPLETDCAGSVLAIATTDLALSAVDNCDEAPALSFTPSSLFPGTTTVVCTATDAAGNISTAVTQVTVLRGPFDCQILKPLDALVDNRIKAGRTVPVKLRVACENVFDPTVTAIIDSIEVLEGSSAFAYEPPEDSGSSNDNGNVLRLSDDEDHYIYNLSTASWDDTSGRRFRVTLRVVKAGHVDSLCQVVLVNK